MKAVIGGFIMVSLSLMVISSAHADGFRPPLPYHYLHPPSTLADVNKPPEPGDAVIRTASGHSIDSFLLFTTDGQAGFKAPAGALIAPPLATHVQVRITAVEVPPGLPSTVEADGNAYSITVTGKPSGLEAHMTQKADLVLRWPHTPTAVYMYANGTWQSICDPSDWILSAETVLCHVPTLGTFLAVWPGAQGTYALQRPSRHIPPSPAVPYMPLLALATGLLITILGTRLAAR